MGAGRLIEINVRLRAQTLPSTTPHFRRKLVRSFAKAGQFRNAQYLHTLV
jgi:hypothetical protein